ncbi:MAG: glucose-6-phosphate dehydrogenase [Candidatus Dormibacteria bacterium]|jgi:glucose-6-phosphate 1-dehydrogenase
MSSQKTTTVVIFGASGDLAKRKVLPALQSALSGDEVSGPVRVVGVGRSDLDDESFRARLSADEGTASLAATSGWVRVDYSDTGAYSRLLASEDQAAQVVFYLATPPNVFPAILCGLAEVGLNRKGDPSRRIVVEKPLGHDLESSRELNRLLQETFTEDQIYRIDHYLAKDTVQNVLALRFSNAIFEAIWNRNLVQSVQITAAEEEGIGSRAGYYDQSGAVRDMVQNHVLQLLALVAMEPPTTFDARDIRKAKLELLRAVRPIDPQLAVRGQYRGYLNAEGVSRGSRRETYVAAVLSVENWRWDGVPFFIRTGKALRQRTTQVVIRFRDSPSLRLGGNRQRPIPTLLQIRIQPHEGITLRIGAKRPGTRFEMVPAGLDLEYAGLSGSQLPDAYEHVLTEVLAGVHTVFPSGDEIDRSWEIVAEVIQAWDASGHPELYPPGTWGPEGADELIERLGRSRWLDPADDLTANGSR